MKYLLVAITCITMIGCSGIDNAARINEEGTAGVSYNVELSSPIPDDSVETTDTSITTAEAENAAAAISTHAATAQEVNGVVEIKEKLFVAQTNDVYLNPQDYLGKKIKYEGIFKSYYSEAYDETYYSVIRYGPGCCGIDMNAGFEVLWKDTTGKAYPEVDDWVEVVGAVSEIEQDGEKFLLVELDSLTVLDTRGEEYVTT
ncbi:MAG: hypothetical protein LBL96_02280 [Clostridiales bacterium]|nr:hypothetical protein [Clostridiales bacterium]